MLWGRCIRNGFQVFRETFIIFWQHKILTAYITIEILLFASIQYAMSYNFTYAVKKAGEVLKFINQLVWSSNTDGKFMYPLWNDQPLIFIFLVVIYSFIMTFFAICLIKHVLQILEDKPFHISLIRQKISVIIAWSLFIAIIYTLRTLAVYYGLLSQDTASWIIRLFTISVFFVEPIIADTRLSIFKAIGLSFHIMTKFWLELLTAFFVFALLWIIFAYSLIALTVNYSFVNLNIIATCASIVVLTIVGIMKTLFYYKLYKKAQS